MSFYSIVLQVALVFLIVIMIYIGVQLYRNTGGASIPEPALCPDYWNIDARGYCFPSTTINRGNMLSVIGSPSPSATGTTPTSYAPAFDPAENKTQCAKFQWANKYGIVWDGISNASVCT